MPNLLKVLLFFLFVGVARWMVSRLRGIKHGPAATRKTPPRPSRGKMIRDPHCGTYVAPELAVPLSHSGETLLFCSESCRDDYLKLQTRKAASS